MSRRFAILALAVGATAADVRAQVTPRPPDARPAVGPPPSTDIWLAPLTLRAGKYGVGTPVNVTRRTGYDNQPSFTPDSRALLFTSVRGDAQADIYRYDLRARTTTRVTSTPESEYSATVYGDGSRFSVIRVEADSTQRLWSFRLDGSDPQLVFAGIRPVGYHAWVDARTAALFLLGSPNALVLADVVTGRADTLARDIDRSLVSLPAGGGFSFVQHAADGSLILTAVDVRTTSMGGRQAFPLPLTRLPRGATYVAWLAPAVALSGADGTLLLWRGKAATAGWTTAADVTRYGLRKISRLAVSPDHRWVAIVAEPAGTR